LSPFTTPDYYTCTDDVIIEGNRPDKPHRDAGGNDERIPVRQAESRLEVLGSVYATPVRDQGVRRYVHRCRLANARPEPDFRQRSNWDACTRSENTT
jgi:hypothetical protein